MKISIARSAEEMLPFQSLWNDLARQAGNTIFQSFDWNLAAARFLAGREKPCVVVAVAGDGAAILPGAIRERSGDGAFLGETLFDYRKPLNAGEGGALEAAWRTLLETIPAGRFEVSGVRGSDIQGWLNPRVASWCGAPSIRAEESFAAHPSLTRAFKRLLEEGVRLRSFDGARSSLLGDIYRKKAQSEGSLFRDGDRRAMACAMAHSAGEKCEVFILEKDDDLVAALVTYLDSGTRRFYTSYFNPAWSVHSPGVALIHHVAALSHARGLHCDLMTGEQPFKLRLATSVQPLYRVSCVAAEPMGIAA